MTDDQQANEPRTALDDAFERAQQDSENTAAFFDALFSATLFIPIHDQVEESRETAGGQSITPLVFVLDEVETVPVFDTEDRLAKFLDEPMNYIGLPGAAVFEMFDGGMQVAVNLGVAPSSVVIPRENVAWLHEQAMQGAQASQFPDADSLTLSAPTASREAVAALTSALAGHRAEIEEACLVRIAPKTGGDGRILLALAPTQEGRDNADAVAHEIARTARMLANGVDAVEIAMVERNSDLMVKSREVGLALPIISLDSLN